MSNLLYSLKCRVLLWMCIKKGVLFWDYNNRKYRKFIKRIEKIDSIQNYDAFFKEIQEMLYSKKWKCDLMETEAQNYGHYNAFQNYANDTFHKITLIPGLEHGVRYISDKGNYYENILCYGFQGDNHVEELHDLFPYKPAFVFGPYIHYAKYYYSKKFHEDIKTKLGKVLLVFPSHTYEENILKREENFVDSVYEKYAKGYDTVMVCVYWHDVNDLIVKKFQKYGAKLVSAGFRGDKNFICRLKTIIAFSDAVVVDGVGTNLGYCMYMGKPIYIEKKNPGIYMKQGKVVNEVTDSVEELFYYAFHSDTFCFTDEQKKLQMKLYETYWGGEKYIKTPKEMKIIFELLEEVYEAAHYNTKKLSRIIQYKLDEWSNSDKNIDKMKFKLLTTAIRV